MEKLQGRITLPEQRFEVIVGRETCRKISGLIKGLGGRAFFVVDAGVPELPDLPGHRVLRIPGGETVKTLEFANTLVKRLILAGARRTDVLVAVGGGAVLDLVGLVAGLLFRGVRLVFCPTTATAMVDAAIGGKTAVNLPQGRNLAGMFKHADLVVVDPEFLLTLSGRDLYAGLFEAIKTGLLAGGDLWDFILRQSDALLKPEPDAWADLAGLCLKFKMQVVKEDPLDTGKRHILNLGHTLGHALEAATNFDVFRHGEAVITGIIAVIELSLDRGLIKQAVRDDILNKICAFPLPALPDLNVNGLKTGLDLDKKSGKWVLLSGIGRPVPVEDVKWPKISQAIVRTRSFLDRHHTYTIRKPGALIIVIHGPNLGQLGQREPEIYGNKTYLELVEKIRKYAEIKEIRTIYFQSDHEGELVAAINHFAQNIDGIIINPGALTHTGIALRDALAGVGRPVAEVHISRISTRESFRQRSIIRPIAAIFIEGQGMNGYIQAIDRLSSAFKS